jgi:hypothetical protein
MSNLCFFSNWSYAVGWALCCFLIWRKDDPHLSVVEIKRLTISPTPGTDAQGCITLHAACMPEGAATVEVVITDAQYVAAEYVRFKIDRVWLVLVLVTLFHTPSASPLFACRRTTLPMGAHATWPKTRDLTLTERAFESQSHVAAVRDVIMTASGQALQLCDPVISRVELYDSVCDMRTLDCLLMDKNPAALLIRFVL